MQTLTLSIDGMTCMGCVSNITRVLTALPGVSQADVSKETASATLTFDETQQNAASFKQAIEDAGFDVRD
ncbi:hypothetical protein BXU06_07805 [Aquaspirillum sp. LM1]|uniref:heavy-metal-associated domain-containing protein n=1 Tax=Aquaspirillum sp. LM1 TaxID=1938604 RepID=UPI000983EA8C|nr:heavy-metal-associated domain-containing protein [Aquaspirillum sp. LM1]AQR64979.1 hypothetical protein BXU06_07805 [Aquaspirillum sp. LM1]